MARCHNRPAIRGGDTLRTHRKHRDRCATRVAEVNGGCRNGSCQASFMLGHAGSTLSNFRVASASAVEKALLAAGDEYRRQAGIDFMDSSFLGSHPGAINFRGYSSDQPGGLPSTHIPWYPSPEWRGAGHIDSPYPYDGCTT